MPRKPTIEPPSREELLALRENHSRTEIAEMFGVSVSEVKRWISRLGAHVEVHSAYGPRSRAQQSKIKMPSRVSDGDGTSNMDRAKKKLGKRLVEDRQRGYILDGKLTRSDDVLRAAGFSVPD